MTINSGDVDMSVTGPRSRHMPAETVPQARSLRLALVYPPYGPLVPGLGLGILSAGVKKLGFDCRTFYWNVDFIRSFPATRARRRVAMHNALSYLLPLNEWMFVQHVFPDHDGNDPRISERLSAMDREKERRLASSWSSLLQDRTRPGVWMRRLKATTDDSIHQMVERLARYDVVGISSTFFQSMAGLALAKRLKAKWPEKTIVLGGANCDDVMGETLLAQFGFLDYVFSGEVDFAFPEFMRRLADGSSLADVPGLVYRDAEGRVTKGPAAVPLEDLNSLPFPDYDDYVSDRESSDIRHLPLTVTLESSRGCWWGAKHHCVFCGLNANGMAFRQKTAERFQAEVEHVVRQYRPRHLSMTDNIISTSYYGGFIDWARSRKLGVDFFYEIKANLNRKQVDRLADAGITSIQPGIESFSSSVLALMNKGIHGIQNVAFLKYASDSGVSAFYGVLGGFAGEDPAEYEMMARNMRLLVHLQPPIYGVVAAQYHRFSPMFLQPRTELRPAAFYSELYPFSEEVLSKLAYYFEPRGEQQYPYFEPVSKALARWREKWNVRGCTLTWERIGDAILVRDRRAGFVRRNIRLVDHAAAVFQALDRPRKLQAVVQELSGSRSTRLTVIQGNAVPDEAGASDGGVPVTAPRWRVRGVRKRIADWRSRKASVSFTQSEFARDPEGCLKGLVDAGVIYVENDWYLTLPVFEYRRPRPVSWIGNFAGSGIGGWLRRLLPKVRSVVADWREIAFGHS